MEYQKIKNLFQNTPNQSSKFRMKIWLELNDDYCRRYDTNSEITFKISMLNISF